MQNVLADILNIDVDSISIKATTHEKMDSFGQREGVKAYAVCLIVKN